MQSENKTLYGIKDEAERYILILWTLTVLLASLIGDSIVLIGTIKYNAIKQHRVIIAVIQHMAVSDILQAVLKIFTNNISLITDRWVFGELICHLEDNMNWVCGLVTIFLTCAMTTLKPIILKYPLKAGAWSSRLGHEICGAIWILGLSFFTPILVANMVYLRDTIHFSYAEYNCNYDISAPNIPTWYLLYFKINFSLGVIMCDITLILKSTLLLVMAKKAASRCRQPLRWEGIATVLLTVAVLLV